jgi:hypothetical protein
MISICDPRKEKNCCCVYGPDGPYGPGYCTYCANSGIGGFRIAPSYSGRLRVAITPPHEGGIGYCDSFGNCYCCDSNGQNCDPCGHDDLRIRMATKSRVVMRKRQNLLF